MFYYTIASVSIVAMLFIELEIKLLLQTGCKSTINNVGFQIVVNYFIVNTAFLSILCLVKNKRDFRISAKYIFKFEL